MSDDWFMHVDDMPHYPMVVGFSGRVVPREQSCEHRHNKAQLLYTVRGLINCEVDGGIWIVPPQCAIWIPSEQLHKSFGAGDVECICLFISPEATLNLPAECCTIAVSNLLQHLLMRAVTFPKPYETNARNERLIAVLLDELTAAPIEKLYLPFPTDLRLKKLADFLLTNPTEHATLEEWASRVALSQRSLSRILQQQVGMSFGRWRRHLHVILALRRLTVGDSVQTVALDLGYESASSFVTMFRKTLGTSPGRYLASRRS